MSMRTNRRTRGIFRIFGGKRDIEAEAREEARQRLVETAHSAALHGAQYLSRTGANGFTILHDDSTGSIYDIDRPQDVMALHNALPREDLFIIAKDQNNELLDSLQTAQTTPWEIVQEYGSAPGYRVTTTGGWRDSMGKLHIDHGLLIATTPEEALSIGKKWRQESVLELDNRGDMMRVVFHNIV
jgi:hypothetical protein